MAFHIRPVARRERVLGQMSEYVPKDRLQGRHRQRNQGACNLSILNDHHGIVGPTTVISPLAHCDKVNADSGNDNDTVALLLDVVVI